MNVLVLNGSPKKQSDTMVLTNSFLKGFGSEHKIDIINVIEKKINPCKGCFACWSTGNGQCIQKDDQNAILQLYKNADLIIWSFPLYCYGMPSHLKAVLDRTIPLVTKKMIEVDGHTEHVPLVDFSKIHTIVICGSGFPNFEHNFEALDLQCKNSFGNLTSIFVPETPLLNIKEAEPVAAIKRQQFENVGKEYAKNLSLTQETIKTLQSLMIPKEEYYKDANEE